MGLQNGILRNHHRIGCAASTALWMALTSVHPARAATDLTLLSLEELMSIKVVGASRYEQKQSEVAAAVSIITREEIRAFGWRTFDEALASLAGIHTTYDRQYAYVGARGFGLPGDYNSRMLVTINGNRANDAVFDSGPVGRDFPIDLDLIERIEFIRGPGGAVYGQNAMFGVVNLITRTGAGVNGTELAASYQNRQRLIEGRASFGKRFDNGVDMLLSFSGMRAKGQNHFFDFGSAGISGVAADLDGERTQQFLGQVARGPWSFELSDGRRRKDDPTGAYRSDPLVAGQYQSDRYSLAQAQYQDSFLGDTVQFQARLYAGRERYTSILNYGTAYSFPATSEWRGGDARLLYTASANHKLLLGLETLANARVEQQLLDLSNPANSVLINSPGSRTSIFAQDEWRVTDTITATLGLRLDRTISNGTATSPRVAMIWRPAPETSLKVLYGRAYREPNSFERDYRDEVSQTANLTLQRESIETLELVVDQRLGSDTAMRASVYQWTMQDLITLGTDPVSGLAQYQSGGAVKARGLEISANKAWPWGGRLRGSLSFQRVRNAAGSKLPNSPELLGKLNFSAPLPMANLRLGYELQYDSARRTINGTDLTGYAVSNLYLSTDQLARGLELGFGIRNLFDKRYAQPGADTNWQNALEQDGRSLRLQATYKF